MILLSIDWTAGSSIGLAIVTAAGTIALAIVGALTYRANASLAQSDRQMLEEVRRDRELSVRPVIAFAYGQGKTLQPERIAVRVRNIGKGPALTCQHWAAYGHRAPTAPTGVLSQTYFYCTPVFSLAAGDPRHDQGSGPHTDLKDGKVPPPVSDLLPKASFEGTFQIEVLVYRDLFGNQCRHQYGKPIADPPYRPDSGKEKPSWAEGW